MAIVAGFVFGYALPEFSTPTGGGSIQARIENRQSLYLVMLGGLIFIQILDVLVSFTFYKFFAHDNRKIAAISGGLRFVYTLIFSLGTFFLFRNLSSETATDDWILANFQSFQNIWTFGLIIFGIHIVSLGYLMKLHGRIHAILWILALIAGCSYSLVSSLKLMDFNPTFTANMEMILAIPMTVGELGLATWMILKGGKAFDSDHLKKVISEPFIITAI
jgi:hypothetical protein